MTETSISLVLKKEKKEKERKNLKSTGSYQGSLGIELASGMAAPRSSLGSKWQVWTAHSIHLSSLSSLLPLCSDGNRLAISSSIRKRKLFPHGCCTSPWGSLRSPCAGLDRPPASKASGWSRPHLNPRDQELSSEKWAIASPTSRQLCEGCVTRDGSHFTQAQGCFFVMSQALLLDTRVKTK